MNAEEKIRKIEKEMQRMQEEINTCYSLAEENKKCNLTEMVHFWNGRAEGFRSCCENLNEIIYG